MESKIVSKIDERRLRDGAKALDVNLEIKTEEERKRALEILMDGMLALQSLDDLGEEGNKRAWAEMEELTRRYKEIKEMQL